MSEASARGRAFELKIGRLARQKGLDVKRDRRSGAGEIYKSDLGGMNVPEMRFSPECKSHSTIKLLDFWRQTVRGARMGQTPVLFLETDEGDLAVLRAHELFDLLRIIQDDSRTIMELRA